MSENTLAQSSSQGQTETVLEDSQINFLLDLIEDSLLFREIHSEYPPSESTADYFTYTLHFTNEDIDNFAVWTDTSSNVPEDLILVAQNIEKIKSEE